MDFRQSHSSDILMCFVSAGPGLASSADMFLDDLLFSTSAEACVKKKITRPYL